MTDVLERSIAAPTRGVRILAITDEVDGRLYNPGLAARRGQYDLVINCGDIPPYYLDFVASTVGAPLWGVHGNHDASLIRRDATGGPAEGWGMGELHGRVVEEQGLLIGGFDGSLRYNDGAYQYTEQGMRQEVCRMMPQLLLNRMRYGRYLDILVTHAPPRHIHDQEDRAHQGFEVFRWFLKTFRPRYHLHGHIHIYNNRTITRTQFHETEVINTYPYRDISVPLAARV
jgi:Icc-related predicted phosphoesterase